jgi:primosomal protein N' (replication factor Y) (superfamily II helicase)
MKIVDVALPIPLNRIFSYEVPEEYDNDILTGRRVIVHFGKRILTGVVVNEYLVEKSDNLKTVDEILDLEPLFSTSMLKLTKWISNYYFCSWGESLKAALPQGMSPKSVLKIKLLKEIDKNELDVMSKTAPRRASIIKELKSHKGMLTAGYLESKLGVGSISSQLEALANSRIISVERVISRKNKTNLIKAIKFNDNYKSDEKIQHEISEMQSKAPGQAVFLAYMLRKMNKNTGFIYLRDAIKESGVSRTVIQQLISKGILVSENIESYDREVIVKDNNESLSKRNEIILELTDEQKSALTEITNGILKMSFNPFLLHGITGSGKTLIYLHTINKTLEIGKTALVLVPEISLTPQLIDRFEKTFPEQVAVLHSRMSKGERYESWKSVFLKEKKIILGVRSAVFAPLKNIGLIIIDEEHDSSYKQNEPAPRYNARDVALMRGKLENAVVVLGSATPSLESMENALSKKYKLLTIKNRADGAKLPKIKILDLIEFRKAGKMFGLLSEDLLSVISEKIKNREGVIVFQNRRGFAPVLECKNCGFIPQCEHCSVPLTYHKSRNKLQCHYCGRFYELIKTCPQCGESKIAEIGFGTQRIEEDLNNYFENKSYKPIIERMDLDSTAKIGAHRSILSRFANGKTDILIGTQMVAKGLDFDRVTLVGIVNADQQLYIPDFRATEKTFQLLTQVSGRAGRTGANPGEVIIQTSHPENFVIRAVKNGSYELFYNEEINNRKLAKYPPFSRFCIIEFNGKDRLLVEKDANAFYNLIYKKTDAFSVYGPLDPYLYKLRDLYRKLIILKNDKSTDANSKEFRKYINFAIGKYRQKYASSSVKMIIDFDSFMPV